MLTVGREVTVAVVDHDQNLVRLSFKLEYLPFEIGRPFLTEVSGTLRSAYKNLTVSNPLIQLCQTLRMQQYDVSDRSGSPAAHAAHAIGVQQNDTPETIDQKHVPTLLDKLSISSWNSVSWKDVLPSDPCDVFGRPFGSLCKRLAADYGGHGFLMVPLMLSVLSACIGPGVQIAASDTWVEKLIFWGVIVAEPGGGR